MEDPIVGEQLLGLPPVSKLYVGAALAVLGGVGCAWLWQQGWIFGGAILALVFGLLLLWTGREELAAERAFWAEIDRAKAEWSELQAGIESVQADGGSVVRYLQHRGYQQYGVRKWLIECLADRPQA